MTYFYVGTAGWSYLQWDKEFYPKGTKAKEKLGYYASQFNAVELNNSFYRMPTAEQFVAWEGQVPQHFRFAVKASRYITHIKRLREPEETLPPFFDALELQQQAGPVFFQLPPAMPLNLERLRNFLQKLPPRRRYALELRDPRWHNEEVYGLLKQYKIAFCLFDMPEGISPRILTADFAYVRLRGRAGRSLSAFLKEWHAWLSDHTKTAHVFFDNREEKKLAFSNALKFRDLCLEKSS